MAQKKKRNVLLNVLKKQCPRCQRSSLYTEPFMLMDPIAMPNKCKVCGQKFVPEPGFYFGAMFISYIISSFFFLSIAAVCILYGGWTVNQAFVLIIAFAIVTYLWFLRISRSLWIHIVVGYDAEFKDLREPKSE